MSITTRFEQLRLAAREAKDGNFEYKSDPSDPLIIRIRPRIFIDHGQLVFRPRIQGRKHEVIIPTDGHELTDEHKKRLIKVVTDAANNICQDENGQRYYVNGNVRANFEGYWSPTEDLVREFYRIFYHPAYYDAYVRERDAYFARGRQHEQERKDAQQLFLARARPRSHGAFESKD